jgi:hypothetical protein
MATGPGADIDETLAHVLRQRAKLVARQAAEIGG